MKFDKPSQKSLTIFFLIFGIFIFFIILREYYYGNDLRVKSLLKEEYNLKVDSVYLNKEEHNFKYVAFSNGEKQSMNFGYEKNDSIVKKKGDSIEYIYRNGYVIKYNILDLLRDYKMKQ